MHIKKEGVHVNTLFSFSSISSKTDIDILKPEKKYSGTIRVSNG